MDFYDRLNEHNFTVDSDLKLAPTKIEVGGA